MIDADIELDEDGKNGEIVSGRLVGLYVKDPDEYTEFVTDAVNEINEEESK